MKIFKGLALFAALEAANCPDQWTATATGSNVCVPTGPWSNTCNSNGTMTITAHINHFYENVPSNIKSQLIDSLKKEDTWLEVSGQSDQLSKSVALNYDMTNVMGKDYIRGSYTFAPSANAALAAKAVIGDISLDLAVPQSFTVECLWKAEVSSQLAKIDIDDNDATFNQGKVTPGNLDVALSLSGSDDTTSKWMLGDTVTIGILTKLDAAITVFTTIEKCTAYSDSGYSINPVVISHGTCAASAINAATVTSAAANFVSRVTFDAFKYNTDSSGPLDAVAYISCDLRICLTNSGEVEANCKAAVESNQSAAKSNSAVNCNNTYP
jgi:hypothetical protein